MKGKEMPACNGCHNSFRFIDLSKRGFCASCTAERLRLEEQLATATPAEGIRPEKSAQHRYQRQHQKIIMTTETALDIPITHRLGIVSAEAVAGMNAIKDIMFGVRDLVGGRSRAQQNAMQDIKEELFDQLKEDAALLSADMIIGVSLRFSDFGGKNSAILATAIGTAVKIEKEQKSESSGK